MTIKVGDKLPDAGFMVMTADGPAKKTTAEIFAGKKVALFAVPGAFTPTCHIKHLPGFVESAGEFKKEGVDTVACVAVNDPFVLGAWADASGAKDKVLFLSDGNGEFTERMGMLVDKSDLNFGRRSWRYSMLVRNKTIEKMFIEPQKPGDPFEVSDADTMLHYINPNARKPDQMAILTREGCSFCAKAKARLAEAAGAIRAAGGRAETVVADAAAPGGVEAIHAAAMERLGGVDVLVGNSGGPPPKAAAAVTPEDLHAAFHALVVPVHRMIALCLPGMRERGWGRIAVIASSGVVQPLPNLALSNALRPVLAVKARVSFVKRLPAGAAISYGLRYRVERPANIATVTQS